MKLKLIWMVISFIREMLFGKYNLYYYLKRRKLLVILFTTIIVLFSISIFSLKEAVREITVSKRSAEKQVEQQQNAIKNVLANEKKSLEDIGKYCGAVYSPTFMWLFADKVPPDHMELLINEKKLPEVKHRTIRVKPKQQRSHEPVPHQHKESHKEPYIVFVG